MDEIERCPRCQSYIPLSVEGNWLQSKCPGGGKIIRADQVIKLEPEMLNEATMTELKGKVPLIAYCLIIAMMVSIVITMLMLIC